MNAEAQDFGPYSAAPGTLEGHRLEEKQPGDKCVPNRDAGIKGSSLTSKPQHWEEQLYMERCTDRIGRGGGREQMTMTARE